MSDGGGSLRFALGPVQSFFAQSRRTRDLWSSSFLVSYLSACAVDAFEEAGAQVVLPDVAGDRLLAAVRAVRRGVPVEDPPEIGSVPNQLTVAADDPAAAAAAAERRVATAWRRICDAVWRMLAAAASEGRGSREIWQRQLGAFWEVRWAIGGAEALARRKTWRGQHRESEPGDKCTLMAGWQELSGYERASEKRRQDRFWQGVRHRLRGFDLHENERLSALALVKRLFPTVTEEAIGWAPAAVHWPSTAYLAARPWLEDLLAHGGSALRDDAETYAGLVVDAAPPAQCREQGAERIRIAKPELERSGFLRLGGGYLFLDDLRIEDRTPLDDEEAREDLIQLLEELRDEAAVAGRRRRPSPFYALLQLDGDRLGKLFEESDDRSATSAHLARFAREAVELVSRRQGLPVYAGGDDLVAFLPLPTALDVTTALAALYQSILHRAAPSHLPVTTSASLVFAHCRSPLRAVVAEGHRMLEEDAKEGNGRGSIAVALWKASGVTARWVTTWEHLVPGWPPADVGAAPAHRIGALAGNLDGGEVSASFLYGQRDALTRLAGSEPWRPGLTVELAEGVSHEDLVRAELARVRDREPEAVSAEARKLAELMRPERRGDDGHSVAAPGRLAFDPLLLARFLSVERPGAAA